MHLRISFFAVCAFLFTSCGQPESNAQHETSSVELEKHADGLAYLKGQSVPYTGQLITFTHGVTRQAVENYVEGRPHGIWLRYWSNGTLKREQKWVHGSHVHQRQWFETGALKEEMEMKDGIAFGQVRLWWQDGRMRRVAFVEQGLSPHGHVLEYNEDGSVLVDAIFNHGKYLSGLRKEDSLAENITAQAH